MEKYLSSNHFQFQEGKAAQSINTLRAAMELVYPRERPLVAIDVEAWERSLSKVTEIGIVVYDPDQLQGSIFPVITPIHIIIKENIKKVNGRFVPDNKHKYLGGTSYVLTFLESRQLVDQIVTKYITKRQGALVGHNLSGDIKWIKSIGVELPESVPSVDTFQLYGLSRSTGATLRGVLRLANIPHGILHNAANDAYYTLVAAMAFCDPEVRKHQQLDVYKELEAKLKYQKRQEKFTDSARLEEDGSELFEMFR
ncbi:uncharacterized protein CANTADRAFT_89163 [Suhomyces tanzawaensis NRRL Y-17324]|uniref:Gfd2/YDR514C-like C-terminal domain-containing protein n=1 Tax=Suhomyces tanzawaensis NRRL Y-17324 TaxID=984487 RepID=A0A1E4SP41_9ASCO|nr:uncharacterized protein CANTADRAFT_89163 [Suhomyces tanzawaensis NRRL Y-17324]ODV81289.1 hypothetical protein CANTADRAFT_89163 [Suhomyces tanzawaensis NRRL Y-17324]